MRFDILEILEKCDRCLLTFWIHQEHCTVILQTVVIYKWLNTTNINNYFEHFVNVGGNLKTL